MIALAAMSFPLPLFILLVLLWAPATVQALGLGSRVSANQAVNVRSAPAGPLLGPRVIGDLGTITGGPTVASLNGTAYTWWQVDWDTGNDGWSFEAALTPQPTLLYGMDVSHWQGTINWTSVAGTGRVFAITKATDDDNYIDPYLTPNFTGGRAAGVLMGGYHFARPTATPSISASALAQARYFIKTLHPLMSTARTFWPVLDLEDGYTLGKSALSLWTRTFCNEVRRLTSSKSIIYMNRNYAQSYMESDLTEHALWIAVPNTTPGDTTFNLGPWQDWAIQQYSWTGRVAGITGDVDLDAFAGDLADLQALTLPALTQTLTAATAVPAAAVRGTTISLTGNVISAISRNLLLGATLYPTGTTTGGISDAPHDGAVTLLVGNAGVQRSFALPATLTAGNYDLWLALYLDLDASGTITTEDLAVGATFKKTNALSVSTIPNYATWAAGQGLLGAAANQLADADEDGQVNLLEYALGTLPGTPNVSPLQALRTTTGLQLRFPRWADRTDLTYTVERSTSLTSWQPLATASAGQPFTGSGVSETGTSPVQVTLNLASTTGPPAFLRLRITKL